MQFTMANRHDIRAIHALEQAVFGSVVYPDFFFRQAHDLWPALLWCARDADGRIGAYALGAPASEAGTGWILSLAVAADYRGQGLGRTLTLKLLQQLQAQGCQCVRLTVDPDNTAAVALYRQLGFETCGQEDDYFGQNEARIVMQYQG